MLNTRHVCGGWYDMVVCPHQEFLPGEFRGSKMPGEAKTHERPLDEIVSFLRKAARSKGGKGESSRKKAFKDTMKFFYEKIFKQEMPDDEMVVPKKPPKKKASSSSSKHRARTPKKLWPYPYGPAHVPVAPVVPGVPDPGAVAVAAGGGEAAVAPGGAPAAPSGGAVEGMAGKSAKDLEEEARLKKEQEEREEEAAELKKVMEADHSIPGLFNLLRMRMDELDEMNFSDQVFWSMKSAMSNVEHLSEKLFCAEANDPEGEEWKKMIQSCMEKLQKQLEERAPHLAPDPQKLIQDVAGFLGELSQSIGGYDLANPDYDIIAKVENYEPPPLPPKKKKPASPLPTTTTEDMPVDDAKEGAVDSGEAEGMVAAKVEGEAVEGKEKAEEEEEAGGQDKTEGGEDDAAHASPSSSPPPPSMETEKEPPTAPQPMEVEADTTDHPAPVPKEPTPAAASPPRPHSPSPPRAHPSSPAKAHPSSPSKEAHPSSPSKKHHHEEAANAMVEPVSE